MQIQTYKVTLWFNISGSIPSIQTSHVTNLSINVKIMVCKTNNVIMRSWPNDFDSDYMKIYVFAAEVCVSRQIETVTVLWVQIVGCQSANQPWPICKPDILFSGQSSLPPLSLARLPLFSVSYRARARVCVFIILPFPHFSHSSYLFNSGYDLSRNFLPCDLSRLPPLLPHNNLFPSLKRLKPSKTCVYTDMCVCVWRGWGKYPPLGSLVRRGSGKCDDHLMFCEAPSFYTHKELFNAQTHTQIHICSVGVVQPQAERLYHCLGIVAFVSSVQRIRLSPPHFLLSFIPHLQPCHSPFLSPPHTIHTRGFFP